MIECAARRLNEGALVAFPTETVYGLGAPVFAPDTIAQVFKVKGRPQDNPLIVHISSFDQLEQIVSFYPERLARHFWPGPLTLILPKKTCVPDIVSAGLPTIGVRMPNHPLALRLIDAVGEPLVAPSANLSGTPSSTTAQHVRDDFGEKVFVLDGGVCTHGIESTVLALDPPTILRPGSVTQEELETFLGGEVAVAAKNMAKPLSPGMKYRHYQPRARVRLIEGAVEPNPQQCILRDLKPEELYARFREADALGYEEIIVCLTQEILSNAALMNRLFRCAH